MTESIHGVVVVDKPVGPTSFDIVHQARTATGARKVGHGGTLDPLASGVLPLCFGEATKLAQFLLDADKEYEATVSFGAETDTYDAGGVVTARQPAGHLSADDVRRALEGFLGNQVQVPPMYSALKRDGKPLYEYARAGETVERVGRAIRIHALDLCEFRQGDSATDAPVDSTSQLDAARIGSSTREPSARIFIRCSKGTYVRSLAYDLGRALGTGAHLTALRRTRSGPFGLDRAISPVLLGVFPLPVVSPADALVHLPTLVVPDDVALELSHGKVVLWARAGTVTPPSAGKTRDSDDGGALIRILTTTGDLLAVAPRGGAEEPIRTLRVFNPISTPG